MLVSDFDYHLPPESIAQVPLSDRAASRMLHLRRPRIADVTQSQASPACEDRWFRELPDLLHPDDLLVLNNTRVFPARLYARRSGERAHPLSAQNPAARAFLQGRVEVLLTRQLRNDPNEWECLVRPGRKIGIGENLYFDRQQPAAHLLDHQSNDHTELEAEVIARASFGERVIRFAPVPDFFARVERLGHIPLPPYIDREDKPSDRDRYQTVYAKTQGSVAAPTAGLHFTPEILDRIRARGIEIAEITLHVGLGTFQPVRVDKVEDHKLHRETYQISTEAAAAINRAKSERRRVVAVGTTTVRTLEDAAERASRDRTSRDLTAPARVEPGLAEAEVFIYPGRSFRVVDALLTNFHLPQSTLLMLVCALGGQEAVLQSYRHAVEAGYRFYSYGDCMFVE